MPESRLDNVRVILHEPQDYVNIAAVVRAMKNMGLHSLRLVQPVHYEPERLEGVAHDTREIVKQIRHYDTLDEALADCVRVAAFSARRRAARWPRSEPRAAARELLEYAESGPVAILFGREDAGLSNEALDRSNVMVTIPTTNHASLNLAQAAMIAMYELHLEAADATRLLEGPRHRVPLAGAEQLEMLYDVAYRALDRIEFFKTRNPEYIVRSLRAMVSRAALDGREVELLRAISFEVMHAMDRASRDRT